MVNLLQRNHQLKQGDHLRQRGNSTYEPCDWGDVLPALFLLPESGLHLGASLQSKPGNQFGCTIILDAEPDITNLPPKELPSKKYTNKWKRLYDLLKAAELMSQYTRNEAEYNIFASEQAANALLSRLYLYMEDNEKAELYATKVLSSNKFELLPKLPNMKHIPK